MAEIESEEMKQQRIIEAAHDIIQHYKEIRTLVLSFTFGKDGEGAMTVSLGKIEDCAMLLCLIAHSMMPDAVDHVVDVSSREN